MFLRNVALFSVDYTALHPSEQNSSKMRLPKMGEIRNESAISVENPQGNIPLGSTLLKLMLKENKKKNVRMLTGFHSLVSFLFKILFNSIFPSTPRIHLIQDRNQFSD
jgi:hypothetical protein